MVLHVSYWVGDWTIVVPAARILDAARHLRDAPEASFDMCSDVTATDWLPPLIAAVVWPDARNSINRLACSEC